MPTYRPLAIRRSTSAGRRFATTIVTLITPLVVALLPIAHVRAQPFAGSIDVSLPNFPRAPDVARCGTAATTLLEQWPSLAGTSTFGAFALAASNCVDRSTGGHFNGLFSFDFGGGRTLFGTYVGQIALPIPPAVGVATATSQTLTILGGTGTFAGATGTLLKAGTFTGNADNTFTLQQTITGTVTSAPEPTTLALLASGLAVLGAGARRRRRTARRAGAPNGRDAAQ